MSQAWRLVGACALVLSACTACGGLLELDTLEFTGSGGAGGSTGGMAGASGSAGAAGVSGAAGAGAMAGAAGMGGAAGVGGAAGMGGSSGNSTGGSDCGVLGSEYADSSALACFNLQVTSGTTYDFSGGALRVIPDVTPWYGQSEGSFFYQQIPSGDFAALSHVRVQSLMAHGGVPQDGFAGGGIVLRGGSGANALVTLSTFGLPTSGNITYGALPQFTPQGSVSSINDLGHPFSAELSGFVGMCRSGSVIFAVGQSDQDASLQLLQPFNPAGNFNPSTFTQLGTATHMFESASPDTEVFVDYLRVNRTSIADQVACLSELENMKNP
ncbi:MAG: hypothetical protein R3B07_35090 [Polyangiaceae bacterium]